MTAGSTHLMGSRAQRTAWARSLSGPACSYPLILVADEDERVVGRIVAVARGLYGSDEEAVGGIHVAVVVKQQERRRGGRLQGLPATSIGLWRLGQEPRHVREPTGHVRAIERCLGQPPAAVRMTRAEIGRPGQSHYGADRVTTTDEPAGGLFEQRCHLLVGYGRRLRQVPSVTLRLIHQRIRERQVRLMLFVPRRQLHNRRPGQRMPERQPPRLLFDMDEPCSLGGTQV